MIQKIAMKTAEKMSEQSIIESKSIHIYAYGLELLYFSLAGAVALIIVSVACGKPFLTYNVIFDSFEFRGRE